MDESIRNKQLQAVFLKAVDTSVNSITKEKLNDICEELEPVSRSSVQNLFVSSAGKMQVQMEVCCIMLYSSQCFI